MRKSPLLVAVAFAALAGTPALAQSDAAAFGKRFDGSWSGGGTVRTSADSAERSVSCSVKGSSTATSVDVSGTCRAAVIVTRKIGASLTLDPATGRYTGTYTGSVIGPARLSGTRQGNRVNLVVTWPKAVNGDTTANMTITNAGDGRFSFVVTDRAEPGGPNVTVTRVNFSK